MKKYSILAAAAFAVLPAAAFAGGVQKESFEYEGARYTYTVTDTPSGRTIAGREEQTRKPFTLHVGKSRVTGYFGFSAVSFSLREVESLTGPVEVALK